MKNLSEKIKDYLRYNKNFTFLSEWVEQAEQLEQEVRNLMTQYSQIYLEDRLTINSLKEEVKSLKSQMEGVDENANPWCYLMYDGFSPDGRGRGQYVGRTYSETVATEFYEKNRVNPYWTGYVQIIKDDSIELMGGW
jgi:hypothetical protein